MARDWVKGGIVGNLERCGGGSGIQDHIHRHLSTTSGFQWSTALFRPACFSVPFSTLVYLLLSRRKEGKKRNTRLPLGAGCLTHLFNLLGDLVGSAFFWFLRPAVWTLQGPEANSFPRMLGKCTVLMIVRTDALLFPKWSISPQVNGYLHNSHDLMQEISDSYFYPKYTNCLDKVNKWALERKAANSFRGP